LSARSTPPFCFSSTCTNGAPFGSRTGTPPGDSRSAPGSASGRGSRSTAICRQCLRTSPRSQSWTRSLILVFGATVFSRTRLPWYMREDQDSDLQLLSFSNSDAIASSRLLVRRT
ncbi:hypothetical protein LTR16_011592, partial [Cryomyces antarcticus]